MSDGARLPGGGGLIKPPGLKDLQTEPPEDFAVSLPSSLVPERVHETEGQALADRGNVPSLPSSTPPAVPRHWRMTSAALASRVMPLAPGVPFIPPSDGSRFTIGYAPGSSLLLNGRLASSATNPTCATVFLSSQGWVVVDGSIGPDGMIAPSTGGVYVNGERVSGFRPIAMNDVILIPEAGGLPSEGHSLVFVDPLETSARVTPAVESRLELGESWFHHRDSDGGVVATASFRGIIDKYDENQDRTAFATSSDGSLTVMTMDGMGGHDSGERAAEVSRPAFYDAIDAGYDLENTIEAMNREMYRDNQARHTRGGAVLAGMRLHPDGSLEVRTVGDAEVIVMSLPEDHSGPLHIDYWSTRPSLTQANSYEIPTLSDGRVALGYERTVRLDPGSNIVDVAGGMRPSTRRDQTEDTVETRPGRTYLAISMSDGLAEQYLSHEEMMTVAQDYVSRTGDVTAGGIRDALLRDALIRCSLCRMACREGRPMEITSARFQQAYREMTVEMEGVASDPPVGTSWRYQARRDARGREAHYFLVPFRGSAYLVSGTFVSGQGWRPDPNVVDLHTGFLRFNPAQVYHPSVLGRFKQDNISLGVASFVRTP